ncbi:hypothetical protein ACQUY5_23730 [Bacillus cereus]|uniref:hypothetical protein n=1 Tax=Bacillus cereus TaxID=1396 RepID=UPI003D16EA51
MSKQMNRKTYKLERTDKEGINYGEYTEFVVVAKDETEALNLCCKKAGEYYRNRLSIKEVETEESKVISSSYFGS